MLTKMCEQYAPTSKVVVLTDQGGGIPLRRGWPGWWAKMELFAPWNKHLRPFFFMDLDTYVLGDISDIVDNPGDELVIAHNFSNRKTRKYGSALMIIPKDVDYIWGPFDDDPEGHMESNPQGDQQYLAHFEATFFQDIYEGAVSVPHEHKLTKRMDRLMIFGGKPKPHEYTGGWQADVWREYCKACQPDP